MASIEGQLLASYSAWFGRMCEKHAKFGLPPAEWNPPGQTKKQPAKPFDYEEYLTRKADRQASGSPQSQEYQRRIEARRARSREYWEQVKERHAFENANRDLAETHALTCSPEQRHKRIWQAVRDAEQAQFVDRVYLRQEDRIANARNARVRGCGAAAKRAGF